MMKKLKINKFNKNERLIISLSIFLILFFISLSYFIVFFDFENLNLDEEEILINNKEVDDEELININLSPRFLDGVLVESDLALLYPVALIIDNDPKIRYPQGLEKASLIYELPTEGGSTRFLAFFPSYIEIEKIGPVRSARTYFVKLAEEFSSLLIHCGGSPQSLAKLSQERITSLNEFYFESYFWRDNNFSRPNNIFIDSNSWQKFLNNQGLRQVNRPIWQFIDLEELESNNNVVEHENIFVNYSKNYQRNWQYNNDLKNYSIENDSLGIEAKNLVFHYSNSRVLDDVLRLEIDLIGEGKAIICQLGICQEGFWRNNSKNERLRYYDKNEEEVKFIRGNTWVSVISAGAYINY